jgi:hypothetical protein
MIEMTIDSIRVNLTNYQQIVVLKEKAVECYLPIFIGPIEARAIVLKLQGATVPRPATHDLLHSVIGALGARVDSVIISGLKSDIFYAKIILSLGEQQVEVDSRPSDALALAVRAQVPILAEEAVLDQAGILLDKETGKPIAEPGEGKTVSEDDLRRISAFTDFLNTLDLSYFDKRRGDK